MHIHICESESPSVLFGGFVTPWTTQSMEFSRPEYWSGWLFPSPGDLPNPGIEPWPSTLQANSLRAEPPGKSKNTGVGSLSLLQRVILTQELNQHCRWILDHLSYQRSPYLSECVCVCIYTQSHIYMHIYVCIYNVYRFPWWLRR